jgi:hypothetical protein
MGMRAMMADVRMGGGASLRASFGLESSEPAFLVWFRM